MPTTPNGLPYPAATDPPNGPLQLQQLAEALELWLPVRKQKAVTTSITNNAGFVDDPHLQISLTPGNYRIEAQVGFTGAAAGDARSAWAMSGTFAAAARIASAPQLGVTDVTNTALRTTSLGLTSIFYIGVDGVATSVLYEQVVLSVTATGLLKFQWGQGTANATATNALASSFLIAQRLA